MAEKNVTDSEEHEPLVEPIAEVTRKVGEILGKERDEELKNLIKTVTSAPFLDRLSGARGKKERLKAEKMLAEALLAAELSSYGANEKRHLDALHRYFSALIGGKHGDENAKTFSRVVKRCLKGDAGMGMQNRMADLVGFLMASRDKRVLENAEEIIAYCFRNDADAGMELVSSIVTGVNQKPWPGTRFRRISMEPNLTDETGRNGYHFAKYSLISALQGAYGRTGLENALDILGFALGYGNRIPADIHGILTDMIAGKYENISKKTVSGFADNVLYGIFGERAAYEMAENLAGGLLAEDGSPLRANSMRITQGILNEPGKSRMNLLRHWGALLAEHLENKEEDGTVDYRHRHERALAVRDFLADYEKSAPPEVKELIVKSIIPRKFSGWVSDKGNGGETKEDIRELQQKTRSFLRNATGRGMSIYNATVKLVTETKSLVEKRKLHTGLGRGFG